MAAVSIVKLCLAPVIGPYVIKYYHHIYAEVALYLHG